MSLRAVIAFVAVAATLAFGAQAKAQKLEDTLVIATTGGLMQQTLTKFFYDPFSKANNVDVVPVAIEIPDQWARLEGMMRTGKVEYDIVTTTAPDLLSRQNMLERIDCSKLKSVMQYGLKDACNPYGVQRTTGGMALAYNTKTFPKDPPHTWADFWDVKKYPGPRGLPDTGDRDWWLPMVALMADGVAPQDLFPMDLDRAYKKLDQIKPYVTVWWKTGDQSQQIMRTGEVVMQLTYAARALQVMKEGQPVAVSWDHAIRDTGYMSIAKGAKDPNAALAYLDFFYANYKNHPAFMRAVNYATSSPDALNLLPENERMLYATYPANYAQLVTANYQWVADHRTMLRDRWTAWLTH